MFEYRRDCIRCRAQWALAPRLRALGLLAALLPAAPHAAERYEGIAYVRGAERIAYRETDWLFDRDGTAQRLVLYRCADRSPFARKRVIDAPSAIAPDFDFEDARDGYREGVRSDHGRRIVFVRENARKPLMERPLPARPDGVLDAGFDAFVRQHFADLDRGRAPRLHFLIPSRFEYLDFALSAARDSVVDGEPARQLRMGLAAWYGFALPAIELTYALKGHRLMEYDGVGTVRDASGHNQNVRIVFPSGTLRIVPDAEVEQAGAEALVSRCAA